MKQFTTVLMLLILNASATADEAVQAFVRTHCTECHTGDSAEGNLDLTKVRIDHAGLDQWVRVYDRVLAGELPPGEKPRPDSADIDSPIPARRSRSPAARDRHTYDCTLGFHV